MMLSPHQIAAYTIIVLGIGFMVMVPTERWHPVKASLFVLGTMLVLALVAGSLL